MNILTFSLKTKLYCRVQELETYIQEVRLKYRQGTVIEICKLDSRSLNSSDTTLGKKELY